jgi:hypothetical protein
MDVNKFVSSRWFHALILIIVVSVAVRLNDMIVREEIASSKSPRPIPQRTSLQEFVWPEARCAVDLPGVPSEINQDVEKLGVVLALYARTAFDGVVTYMAAYVDYPPEVALPESAEELATWGEWQFSDSHPDAEVVAKPVTHREYAGVEVRISGKPGSRSANRTRLILVGRRGFVQTVTATPGELDSRTADQFFESFRVLDDDELEKP